MFYINIIYKKIFWLKKNYFELYLEKDVNQANIQENKEEINKKVSVIKKIE